MISTVGKVVSLASATKNSNLSVVVFPSASLAVMITTCVRKGFRVLISIILIGKDRSKTAPSKVALELVTAMLSLKVVFKVTTSSAK